MADLQTLEGAQSPSLHSKHNRLILHPSFRETVTALKDANVSLPRHPNQEEMTLRTNDLLGGKTRLVRLEEQDRFNLDVSIGEELAASDLLTCAYDESINKFSALEGTAYYVSHSLVVVTADRYLPVGLLTLNFYTRSKDIQGKSEFIKFSNNPSMDSEIDYMEDRIRLLTEYVPANSVLFIDGPLIAGDAYVRMIRSMGQFHEKLIVPIFFVKNSDSNIVTDNTVELKGKYNSDLHYVHKILKPGQRTSFFRYTDLNNPKNSKCFCYLKSMDVGAVRVEFHTETFEMNIDQVPSLMNLIHYLILVQGDRRNPQVRPIAIAEKFARDTLRLVNLDHLMRWTGVTPTMNQERGMVRQ